MTPLSNRSESEHARTDILDQGTINNSLCVYLRAPPHNKSSSPARFIFYYIARLSRFSGAGAGAGPGSGGGGGGAGASAAQHELRPLILHRHKPICSWLLSNKYSF